jgi:hypothetical protein
MESFEPEHIRAELNGEDEYNNDLRGRLAAAPVFEDAAMYQMDFQSTRVQKENLIGAWNAAHKIIAELDEAAISQGVMYESIILRGEGIQVPKADIDFSANIAMMSLLDKDKQRALSFANYLQEDEFRGPFAGFTVRFAETEDEDVFAPVLAYRVSMHNAYAPNGQMALFATGDVGTTNLHFHKDERLEGALAPLSKLFELCPEKAETINRINMTLAGEDVYDASVMRHVGYHAEKIVANVDESLKLSVESAIIDLITNYVDKEAGYKIQSKQMAVLNDADLSIEYFEADDNVVTIKNKYIDIVFRDHVVFVDGAPKAFNRRTIHLTFQAGRKILYIPITNLNLFEKQ